MPARYLLGLSMIFAFFLMIFLVLSLLPETLLADPRPWLGPDGVGAAVGVALLLADVVVPVPASLVIIALGAYQGVLVGACLGLLGSVGAALIGYGLGHSAGPSVLRWTCSEADRARVDALITRWGMLAVAASRPVPLLAETVAVAAGASRLGIGRTLLAATLGALPACVMFALAGAYGLDGPSGFLVFGAALALASGLWLAGRQWRRLRRPMAPRHSPQHPADQCRDDD